MSEEKETHNYVLAYVAMWISFAVVGYISIVCFYKYKLREIEVEEQIRKEQVSPVMGVSK